MSDILIASNGRPFLVNGQLLTNQNNLNPSTDAFVSGSVAGIEGDLAGTVSSPGTVSAAATGSLRAILGNSTAEINTPQPPTLEGTVKTFNSVTELKAQSGTVSGGEGVLCAGFSSFGDGGQAFWEITDGASPPTANDATVHSLGGNKRAALVRVPNGVYDVRQVGIFGANSKGGATGGGTVATKLLALWNHLLTIVVATSR